MITLYGIAHCDTVKKARAWLQDAGVDYTFHDFKKQGLEAEQLARWIAAVGWQTLLNRQGLTWRKLDAASKAAVHDAASAQALMLANLSVIKRPVIEAQARVWVGFDAAQFAQLKNQ